MFFFPKFNGPLIQTSETYENPWSYRDQLETLKFWWNQFSPYTLQKKNSWKDADKTMDVQAGLHLCC